MLHALIANENCLVLFDYFQEYQGALPGTDSNHMAAMGNSLSFRCDLPLEELPEGGWDWDFGKTV